MTWMSRRKRRNRYLLEVRVHSQARTRARVRWLGVCLVSVMLLGAGGYVLYRFGRHALDWLLYANPRFRITELRVETDGVLTPQQVMRFAGVQPGQNLFAVNLGGVRRNLESVPQIAAVEIRRELPNRFIIRLQERRAVARLQISDRGSGDGVFYVDRTGVAMRPVRLGDGTVIQPLMARTLPLVTGIAVAEVRIGSRVESERLDRALALLEALEQSGAGVMLEVEQIDASRQQHLTVRTRQGMTIRFDVANFRVQLRRLGAILAWAQQRQRTIAHVDLTVQRGVPVLFAATAQEGRGVSSRRS